MSRNADRESGGISRGQALSTGIAAYIAAKQILNMIIGGFSLTGLLILLFGIGAGVCFWFGVKKSNLVAAVLMMLTACAYLPNNLKNIGLNVYLLYSAEGLLDMAGAMLLAFQQDIRKHCKCQ